MYLLQQAWSLNFSQCVEGRRWWLWAREGLEEAYVFAGDAPCHGEETRRAPARCDALQIRLSRFKLAEPPTPRDTEASNAYAIMHDSLGPVCICRLIGINSIRVKCSCLRAKVAHIS